MVPLQILALVLFLDLAKVFQMLYIGNFPVGLLVNMLTPIFPKVYCFDSHILFDLPLQIYMPHQLNSLLALS